MVSNILLSCISTDNHPFSVTKGIIIRKKFPEKKNQGYPHAFSIMVCVEMPHAVNSKVPKPRWVSTG